MCPGAGVEVADDLRQQEGQGTAPAFFFGASSRRGDASRDRGKPDVESGLRVGCGARELLAFNAVTRYLAWLPNSFLLLHGVIKHACYSASDGHPYSWRS